MSKTETKTKKTRLVCTGRAGKWTGGRVVIRWATLS
jgi:hypothetical protein